MLAGGVTERPVQAAADEQIRPAHMLFEVGQFGFGGQRGDAELVSRACAGTVRADRIAWKRDVVRRMDESIIEDVQLRATREPAGQTMFRVRLYRRTEVREAVPAVVGVETGSAGEPPVPLALGGEGGDDEQRECWK